MIEEYNINNVEEKYFIYISCSKWTKLASVLSLAFPLLFYYRNDLHKDFFKSFILLKK